MLMLAPQPSSFSAAQTCPSTKMWAQAPLLALPAWFAGTLLLQQLRLLLAQVLLSVGLHLL